MGLKGTNPALIDALDGNGVEVIPTLATAGLDDHQVGFLQHAQMLDDADARDFGKGGTHRPGGPPSLAQQIENLTPSRVGQSLPNRVQIVSGCDGPCLLPAVI